MDHPKNGDWNRNTGGPNILLQLFGLGFVLVHTHSMQMLNYIVKAHFTIAKEYFDLLKKHLKGQCHEIFWHFFIS